MTAPAMDERIRALSDEQRRIFYRTLVKIGRQDDSRLVAYVKARSGREFDGEQLGEFLAGRLPGYMMPSRFIQVATLPRLANGKVDRKRLPQVVPVDAATRESEEQTRDFVSSSPDALESQLAAIWARNLHTDYVLPDDDFFELGGHSLMGVQLLLDVKQEFGVDIPLADLFETPCLKDMVARIRRPDTGSRVVATIQAGRDRTPIFAVHGGDKCLAAAFGPDRPLYLVFDSISTTSADMSSIETIAEYYLHGIRKIQPHGPYLLCGYSLGGMIAYEIAQRLTKAGEEVRLVGIFDTTPPRVGRWGLTMRAYHLFSRVGEQQGPLNRARYLFVTVADKLWRTLRAPFTRASLQPRDHEEIRNANTARYIEIGFRYRYRESDLNCVAYMPEHHPMWVKYLLRKWQRVLRGPFTLECVEGARKHEDMTRPPYDAKAAKSFAKHVMSAEAAEKNASETRGRMRTRPR